MKFFLKVISFYIFSLGFFLLKFTWFNFVFECSCTGDIFPKYYAFPFIYKSDSLASSLAEVFYISGILLNGLVITFLLLIIDFYLLRLIKNKKFIVKTYLLIQLFLLLLSGYSFYISYTFLGDDNFEWKSDFREEVRAYSADCKSYFKGFIVN
ncbi:hypothetical protein [Chryseobacterium sp. Leaf394]|uniref:hypothetical protein n=1 Tax=Chryseobacterium sp. Leaf394 TaxID=1736361 RepID=UPI000FF8AA6D|nr:hypothetical protein [Chryseobacterium sp. Leaf394]